MSKSIYFLSYIVFFFYLQKHYTESRDIDTISRVHGELDELKNIMVRNIGKFGKLQNGNVIVVCALVQSGSFFNKIKMMAQEAC